MQVSKSGSLKVGNNVWIKAVFLILLWLLIMSMVRDFWQTQKGFSRISETDKRLLSTKSKNKELTEKLRLVSGEEYKNRLIRDKLNMQRADEVVVIMPNIGTKAMGLNPDGKDPKNWQKWIDLLGLNLKSL
jgi:hypothetical protein